MNIAIVGGGAAGLATAIFAAEAGATDIVVFDGAKQIGAKILVAGGGRCNVTHDRVGADDYQGPRPVVRNILNSFTQKQTVEWFAHLGVQLKHEDTGKLFPVTNDAHTVLHAMLRRCEQLGIDVRTQHRVTDVKVDSSGFELRHSQGSTRARRIVLATGGRSLPKTGSDGGGYALARKLGHTVTPTYPALAPLVLSDEFFHTKIRGVSHEVELSTFVDGKRIDRRAGSLLWTHFGISGPVVMDASRFWIIAHAENKSAELRCSFAPRRSFDQLDDWLQQCDAKQAVGTALAANLPRRLIETLCEHVQLEASQRCGQLSRDKRRALVHALTALKLPVVRDRGWNYAEVTAGGVPVDEIDYRTMASRQTDGVYLIGEILDVDGRIGGFNFQWAWSTAHAAGAALGVATT